MSEYYVSIKGKIRGPLSCLFIAELYTNKKIDPTTQVKKVGENVWMEIKDVEEFVDIVDITKNIKILSEVKIPEINGISIVEKTTKKDQEDNQTVDGFVLPYFLIHIFFLCSLFFFGSGVIKPAPQMPPNLLLFCGFFSFICSMIYLIKSNVKIWIILIFVYPFVFGWCVDHEANNHGKLVFKNLFSEFAHGCFVAIYFISWFCKGFYCWVKWSEKLQKEQSEYSAWYGNMNCNECSYEWKSKRQTPPSICPNCRSKNIEAVIEKPFWV